MVTICAQNISDKTRGMIKRYMYEMSPGIFVGAISTTQKKEITDYVLANNEDADILTCSDHCGHVLFESHGDPKRFITDFDGLALLSRDVSTRLYKHVYAKPDKTLLDHMLETGWTAKYLIENGIYAGQINVMSKSMNVPKGILIDTICWLIAIHDIGKAHPVFQFVNMPNAGNEYLQAAGFEKANPFASGDSFRHEQYSALLVAEHVLPLLKNSDFPDLDASDYGNIVKFHHQAHNTNNTRDLTEYDKADEWKKLIINPLFDIIDKEFLFTDLDFSRNYSKDTFGHFVLGLEIISDRIASVFL